MFSAHETHLSTTSTSSARKKINSSCGDIVAVPLLKMDLKASTRLNTILSLYGLTLTRKEWFTLEATLEGDRIALAINGIEQGVFFDDAYPRGKVGVWTWDTQASFDNVSVTGVTTTPLTAVEPHGKLATSWAALKRRTVSK